MITYLLAIGSAVLYGAADFTGGLTARRGGAGTLPIVILSLASGLVLLALMLPLLPPASPARADLLWGAAAGVTGGIGVALLYRALAIGTMAVVAPTTAVCAVAIPVVVAVLLGERPVPLAVVGIVLGIASIVLVSRQSVTSPSPEEPALSEAKGREYSSGVGTALASGVAIGLFLLTIARTGSTAGMWPLIVARAVSVLLFGAAAAATGRSLRLPPAIAGLVVVGGMMDVLANALYMVAARQGPLSVVVTLSSLYPASTILLARVVLGERLNWWQRGGVGCALLAVLLIVSSR
ncbi:MAG TPA: DMT family transporter [Gemmatimonadales bacterium]|nr:DMT family transporter [Gemmatimonadales bacterium]